MLLVDKQDSGKPLTQKGDLAQEQERQRARIAPVAWSTRPWQGMIRGARPALVNLNETRGSTQTPRQSRADDTSQSDSHLDESGTPVCTDRARICIERLPRR